MAATLVCWEKHFMSGGKTINKELYGDLPKITTRISQRRLQFAGHCKRSEGKIISELVTWRPTQGRRSAGRPTKTYVDLLHQDTGFTSHEIEACIQDRRLWKAIIGVRQKMPEWVSEWVSAFQLLFDAENHEKYWLLVI